MKTQVAIVGGGPCGLASSLLLSRFGIENVLLEKHPDISFHPKAMGITRRSAEIFRSLGILSDLEREDILEETPLITRWSKSLIGGEDLGEAPAHAHFPEFSPCRTLHCPQPSTEAALRKAAEAESNATLRFGRKMRSFSQDESGVRILHEARAGGDEESLEALWLIAADGDASPTRAALGIETEGPGDLGHFVNVYFRARYGEHLDRHALLHNVLNQHGFETFVSVNNRDLWLMHHYLDEGETPDDYDAEKFVEIIKGMSGLEDEDVDILGMSPWVMSPRISREWKKGRIFLTGDASARLSPAGGLGMNTGLQSAHNLAWKVASVVRSEASESLLESYGEERLGVIDRIFENSTGNAAEVFSVVGKGLSGDWDGVKEELSHTRRAGSGLGLDLGLAYPAGAFLPDGSPEPQTTDPVNDFHPDARPGVRAPHLPLHSGGSILDNYGNGFTLVFGPDGEDWETAAAGLTPDRSFPLGLKVLRSGKNLPVDTGKFHQTYGISPEGAVLVRPDGIVGARWKDAGNAKSHLRAAAEWFAS